MASAFGEAGAGVIVGGEAPSFADRSDKTGGFNSGHGTLVWFGVALAFLAIVGRGNYGRLIGLGLLILAWTIVWNVTIRSALLAWGHHHPLIKGGFTAV